MNRFVEERAVCLAAALRIMGFPADEDTERAAGYLGAAVQSCAIPGAKGILVREGRKKRILLPAHLRRRPRDLVLGEELAHLMLSSGLASYLRTEGTRVGHQKLARVVEWRDEMLARQFVQAWFLPGWLCAVHEDDQTLMELSGCTLDMVRERRRFLAGTWVDVTSPPHWCAAREWVLHRYRHPLCALHLVPRDTTLPQFVFPSTATKLEGRTQEVKGDLIALTAAEFAFKHAEFIPSPAERIDIGSSDFTGHGATAFAVAPCVISFGSAA